MRLTFSNDTQESFSLYRMAKSTSLLAGLAWQTHQILIVGCTLFWFPVSSGPVLSELVDNMIPTLLNIDDTDLLVNPPLFKSIDVATASSFQVIRTRVSRSDFHGIIAKIYTKTDGTDYDYRPCCSLYR